MWYKNTKLQGALNKNINIFFKTNIHMIGYKVNTKIYYPNYMPNSIKKNTIFAIHKKNHNNNDFS